MSLTDELIKPEYQSGSYAERLALLHSKTAPVVGRIEQGNLKSLEAIIAAGLWRDKMDELKQSAKLTLADSNSTVEEKQLAQVKLQVVAGFDEAIPKEKLANKAPASLGGHSVNLNDPMVIQTFNAAQLPGIGLLTPTEVQQVLALATYNQPLWLHITVRDVVAHFEPEKVILDDWIELDYQGSRLSLTVHQPLPAKSLIRIESSESMDGQHWSRWTRVSHFYDVDEPGVYFASLPNSPLRRKIRWRGEEYAIDGSVVGV